MNQVKVDLNAVIRSLSEQIQQMSVSHAYAMAIKDAEIAELKSENDQLRKEAVAQMDAEGEKPE